MDLTYSGIAAADALDALNSRDDFEPAVTIDTEALDTALDALKGAAALTRKLEALVANLSAGGNTAEATGLGVDVRLIVERLDAITAWSIA